MSDLLNPLNIFAIAFEVLIKGFFAFSIVRLLAQIKPENRKIQPGLVWLLVVPGWNLIWNFFVAFRLAESIKKELENRDFDVQGQPTIVLGLIFSLISISTLFIPVPTAATTTSSIIYGVAGMAALIVFVQYWSKISWYRQLFIKDSEESEANNIV